MYEQAMVLRELRVKLARVDFALGKYETVQMEVIELERKLDAMAELLGIAVVAGPDKGAAEVTDVRRDGFLDRVHGYIEATKAIELLVQHGELRLKRAIAAAKERV
jgi:hypothetical protein